MKSFLFSYFSCSETCRGKNTFQKHTSITFVMEPWCLSWCSCSIVSLFIQRQNGVCEQTRGSGRSWTDWMKGLKKETLSPFPHFFNYKVISSNAPPKFVDSIVWEKFFWCHLLLHLSLSSASLLKVHWPFLIFSLYLCRPFFISSAHFSLPPHIITWFLWFATFISCFFSRV